MTALRMVVAFKIEASPLIEHYGLQQRKPIAEFPIFENDCHALVLSGLGSAAAAAATKYLHETCLKQQDCTWLNIGIAGHPRLAIGTVVLASQIADSSKSNSWKTSPGNSHQLPTSKLITVNTPETEYKYQALYDMEAAGFYVTALQYTQNNRIQCLKVVSDNRDSPLHTFSTQRASELMQKAKPVLLNYIDVLLKQDTP
ncbi:MAG: hypothetical protein JXA04_10320 [Gammaproteobacteria bacterium]|nr:hypothetical protein [Gammaproteobacteria bacterium]